MTKPYEPPSAVQRLLRNTGGLTPTGYVTRAVWVDLDLHEYVDHLAKVTGHSYSHVLRELASKGLELCLEKHPEWRKP